MLPFFLSQLQATFPQFAVILDKIDIQYGIIERSLGPSEIGQKETFELDADGIYFFMRSELIVEDRTGAGSIDQVPDLFLHPQGELQRLALVPTMVVDKSQWVYKSQQILIHGKDLEHYLQLSGTFTHATYRMHYIQVEINS